MTSRRIVKAASVFAILTLAAGCKSNSSNLADPNSPESRAAAGLETATACQITITEPLKQVGIGDIKVIVSASGVSTYGWIGLFRPGTANNAYGTFTYISNGQNQTYYLRSPTSGTGVMEDGLVEVRSFCGGSTSTRTGSTPATTLLSRAQIFDEERLRALPPRPVNCPANTTSPYDFDQDRRFGFIDYKVGIRAFLNLEAALYMSSLTPNPEARLKTGDRIHAQLSPLRAAVADPQGRNEPDGSTNAILFARGHIWDAYGFDKSRPSFIEGLTLVGTRNTAPAIAAYLDAVTTTCRWAFGSEPGHPTRVFLSSFEELNLQGLNFQQCEANSFVGDESADNLCVSLGYSGGKLVECSNPNRNAGVACFGRNRDTSASVRYDGLAFSQLNGRVGFQLGNHCNDVASDAKKSFFVGSACQRWCVAHDSTRFIGGFAGRCNRVPDQANDSVSCVCSTRLGISITNRIVSVPLSTFAAPGVGISASTCSQLHTNPTGAHSAAHRLCTNSALPGYNPYYAPPHRSGVMVECGNAPGADPTAAILCQ